jgi:predicted house-cleaning noncanonical NTP pyrophosphatase (MazG superfamily)
MRKLIRDGLIDRIPRVALSQAVSDEQHRDLLADKIGEEVDEIRRSGYNDPYEFADALEALMQLAVSSEIRWDVVEACRVAKKAEKGGFARGLLYDQDLDPEKRP